MQIRHLFKATRSCASILAAEIIWSAGASHHIEENLYNSNGIIPEQHIEDFYHPDRYALNQEKNTASVTGTGTAFIFNGSSDSSAFIL
jgi:hypothetical protein